MKKYPVLSLAVAAGCLVFADSMASACSTCLAGRGSADSFSGGVIAVGGMAPNPFHAVPTLQTDTHGGYTGPTPSTTTYALNNPQSFYQAPNAPASPDTGAEGLARLLSNHVGADQNLTGLAGQLDASTLRASTGANPRNPVDPPSPGLPPLPGGSIVPEPASLGLLCVGLFGLLRRRR